MRKKKTKKESGEATRASVREEMAKPRMAKSAREDVLKRSAGRITPVNQRFPCAVIDGCADLCTVGNSR